MICFSFFNIKLVIRKLKGSHIKWWHVLATYLNIFKIFTKPKSIGKCSNMIFNFLQISWFFSPKKKSDQIILFHIYFSHLCKISNKNKSGHDMCIWMFSITWLHFERITWIFVYDVWHNHFWKKLVWNLILWIMNWWQPHLRLGAHLKRWQRK
jgi:hypothetical protein